MSERLSGKKKKTADPEKAKRRDIYEWIRSFISALIICVILFVFFFRLISVRSVSMNPTLYEGDMMLVSTLLSAKCTKKARKNCEGFTIFSG
jgi:signal peptidase I